VRGGGRRGRRAMAAGGGGLATLIAVPLIAVGVPLVWVWIASKLAGTRQDLTPTLAVFITTGILISYWLVLIVGSWVRRRRMGPEADRPDRRRMSWNRSYGDQRGDRRLDPIELVFVLTALVAVVGFEIWFFFFAGDPLPAQPAF
jgi:multisubunit Na+/H+ antiporter MnhC subunit